MRLHRCSQTPESLLEIFVFTEAGPICEQKLEHTGKPPQHMLICYCLGEDQPEPVLQQSVRRQMVCCSTARKPMGGALQRPGESAAAEAIMQSMLKQKDRNEQHRGSTQTAHVHCSQWDLP